MITAFDRRCPSRDQRNNRSARTLVPRSRVTVSVPILVSRPPSFLPPAFYPLFASYVCHTLCWTALYYNESMSFFQFELISILSWRATWGMVPVWTIMRCPASNPGAGTQLGFHLRWEKKKSAQNVLISDTRTPRRMNERDAIRRRRILKGGPMSSCRVGDPGRRGASVSFTLIVVWSLPATWHSGNNGVRYLKRSRLDFWFLRSSNVCRSECHPRHAHVRAERVRNMRNV